MNLKKFKNHITKIEKREGEIVPFDRNKIEEAIFKALTATDEGGRKLAKELSLKVTKLLNKRFKKDEIPNVEQIQDIVEEVLVLEGLVEAAKAYILYREQRRLSREAKVNLQEAISLVDDYFSENNWEVKENSNMAFSLQGLNHYVSAYISKKYWLNRIYPQEIRKANEEGDLHIHNLDILGAYCCGWDLYDVLLKGFGGVIGKIQSKPPKHFRTALGQVVNYFYTLQGESAGAQAFSNFDTLLAPFIRYDNLSYREIKQSLQEFLFNCNVPTRVGFQTPFENLTLDLKVPEHLKEMPVILGGQPQKETYKEFQKEMDIFNQALTEVYIEGDASGRVFTFPIPTYNITKDFEWKNETYNGIWQMTAKYGIPYFCLDENIEVITSQGIKKIRDLSYSDYLLSEEGDFRRIKFKKKIRSRENIILEGENFRIVCSLNHRFPTKEGIKKAKDLNLNDHLLRYEERVILENGMILDNYTKQFFKIDNLKNLKDKKFLRLTPKHIIRKLPSFKYSKNRFQTTLNHNIRIPKDFNEDIMELIGIILGDGNLRENGIRIVNTDREILDFVRKTIEKEFKLAGSIRQAGHSKVCKELSFNSVILANFLEYVGLRGNTYSKRIPEICYWRSEKELGALLRGLFDTDGSIILNRRKDHILSISLTNSELMNDVLVLLAKIGIVGKLNKLGKKGSRIIITGERNINLFKKKVGFRVKRKNDLLGLEPKNSLHPAIGDKIVFLEQAVKLDKHYAYQNKKLVRIKSKEENPYLFIGSYDKNIKEIELKKIEKENALRVLYDVTIDSPSHLFVLKNGIISHNSNFINSDLKPEDARSMCLLKTEEVIIKENGVIKRKQIGELVEQNKLGEFDEDGWVEYQSNKKLEALSLNYLTGRTEWAKVIRFLKKEKKQLITIITTDGKEIKCSSEHLVPVLTDNGLVNKFAKDITENDYLLSLKKVTNLNNKYQKIQDDLYLDENLAKILGYFTADGNYLFENRKSIRTFGQPKGLQFTFNNKTKAHLKEIRGLIQKVFGLETKEKKDPRYNSYYLYVYNSEISRILYNAGFKKYGRLPDILFNSPYQVIENFLFYHFKGDGYEERQEIHLNDRELSRDLVILYSLIGKPVSYKERPHSQRIYLQHQKSEIRQDGYLATPLLFQRVPGFLAKSTYLVPRLVKTRMVGINTLYKYQAVTPVVSNIKESDYYISKIKSIKVENFSQPQTFFDLELEKNHLFVHSLGSITHNCCRLRLDNRELYKRGGGLFGANPLTGSIGVVTINLPRIGYLSKTKKEFFERLSRLMDLAKTSLEIKRKVLEDWTDKGLYPYSRYYLSNVKKMRDSYWGNHFSTIGIIGMNEALLNFLDVDIGSRKGKNFSLEVLDFMREKLIQYQEETGNLYNLEATPAEGTSYRLALLDKKKYPEIITSGEKEPFYTNSTQLPVNYTDDLFEALKLQDELQTKYTGGCIEKGNKILTSKGLIKIEDIVNNFSKFKSLKVLSYNPNKGVSEWDEVSDAVAINVKKNNKIRIRGERGLNITTSDWHPFFVLQKIKPNPHCPICQEEVVNVKRFAAHLRYHPECRHQYSQMFKYLVLEKRADELKKGDYILQNSINLYPEKQSELNNDLMWLIGFFIGDGSISKFYDNRGGNKIEKYIVRFFSEHQEALNRVQGILSKYFDCQATVIQNDKRSEKLRSIATSKKEVWQFFFKYNFFSGEKTYTISVPEIVKENITNKNFYALLSGLIDSDGYINNKDGSFEYFTVSEKLADDILEICSVAGIMVSKIPKKTKRNNEVDIWRLRIPSYELIKIKNSLINTVHRDRIKDSLSNRTKRFLPVVRVKETSKVNVKDNQFYDLTTKKNHNYLAGKNSLVFVHNTVFHAFLGEAVSDPEVVKSLIKTIFERFKLPYLTLTPTFSVCPVHGYINGEHFTCPKCLVEQPCEVYSRIVGYLRPVSQWHFGKQEEFRLRKTFKV